MAFTTRKSLLAKVRSGDQVSWTEFYNTYKPLIRYRGFRCGLNANEQDELVQQVMCEVFKKDIVGKYDPETVPENVVFQYDPSKGRFRHYLGTIARYQAIKIFKKRTNALSLDDDEICPPHVASEDQWNFFWDEEWHQHVLTMALAELRGKVQPDTFAAFEMYALQNRPVEQVAEFLDMSVSSVYTDKSRCITALKSIIKDLEDK